MVIVSLVGAIYGSFKPEIDARESHKVLAPVVDQTSAELIAQNERLIALEAKNEVYEQLFVTVFAKEMSTTQLKKVEEVRNSDKGKRNSIPEVLDLSPGKPKRRKEFSLPSVQQRQKAYWEE